MWISGGSPQRGRQGQLDVPERRAVLGSPDGPDLIGSEFTSVTRDGRGRYYVSGGYSTALKVFDEHGTFIAEGRAVTYDMKPTRDDPTAVGTSEVADALIERMEVLARA